MAIASSPKRSEKKGQGSRSETLNFGNTSINRNDWAYCDQNGILISTKELNFKSK
jgi:Demethylmenaquinone methyltransferase